MILYEYPLNERIRGLLRLEDVFQRFEFFRDGDAGPLHVQAVATLFDLLDITDRSEVRSDLLQLIDAQRTSLQGFRQSPGVSAAALEQMLGQMDACHAKIGGMTGKIGHKLRDNEWLMGVRSRILIAGGAADYDMPSFWAWQNQEPERRRRQLDEWFSPFVALRSGVGLVLRLLRESGKPIRLDATDGSCQHSLGGKNFQMARLRVDGALQAVPEISANRYLLWIRFNSFGTDRRAQPLERSVPFELTLCNL